ncbi:tRNA nucleotidyltransferase/poly(A) polymerase family protein [Leptospira ryugenii]|uniref:tRNA nucleotidyltransferase/poly(A) polymerase family protein n=1 Tax=Leptospira ryugenii TaxID=1917863 RepID=A0A2P2E4I0_9LEPT|nr:tRNA nucleotidyltransferase/poly(A) polymerase family protein [Leptospira ryugenii]
MRFLIATIKSAGHEAYLIGGSVRDLCMGKTPKDFDLTTSAPPETIQKLFPRVIATGIQHGTVTVLLDKIPYEVTTYRIDKDYQDGRRPSHVEFGTSLSEDLRRRDFTMNALAYDLDRDLLVDEHGGQEDILRKTIKTIGKARARFEEDGLRPIRALRFASVLGFSLEAETKAAIAQTRAVTAKVSVERFLDELLKSFRGPSPATMLRLLWEEDLLSLFCEGLPREPLDREELALLDQVPKEPVPFLLGQWSLALSSEASPLLWEGYFQNLRCSQAQVRGALFYRTVRNFPKEESYPSDRLCKERFLSPLKLFLKQSKEPEALVWEFLLSLPEPLWQRAKLIWDKQHALVLADLVVNGRDLEKNFPNLEKQRYGYVLSELLARVWEDPNRNEVRVLLEHCAEIISNMQAT